MALVRSMISFIRFSSIFTFPAGYALSLICFLSQLSATHSYLSFWNYWGSYLFEATSTRKTEDSYRREAGQIVVRRSLKKDFVWYLFFSFCDLTGPFFFFFEERKRGGGYVFNYFAYIVTLLRLWVYLGVFLSRSPPTPPSTRLPSHSCHPTHPDSLGGLWAIGWWVCLLYVGSRMRISILSWIRDGLWDLVVTDNNEKEKDKTKKKKTGGKKLKMKSFTFLLHCCGGGFFFLIFLPWWVPIVLCRFFLFWWFLLFWCFFPAFSRFFFRFAWFLTVFLHG